MNKCDKQGRCSTMAQWALRVWPWLASVVIVVSLLVYISGYTPQLPQASGFNAVPPWASELPFPKRFKGGAIAMTDANGWPVLARLGLTQISHERLNICHQLATPNGSKHRLKPVLVGYGWERITQMVENNRRNGMADHYGISNPLIDSDVLRIPDLRLQMYSGIERFDDSEADARITVQFSADRGDAVLITDAPYAASDSLMNEAWLLWKQVAEYDVPAHSESLQPSKLGVYHRALRMQWQQDSDCELGALSLRVYEFDEQQYTRGIQLSRWVLGLAEYVVVPKTPQHRVSIKAEDQVLFEQLIADNSITLGSDLKLSITPKDQAFADYLQQNAWPEDAIKAREKLHFGAVGQFVQQQVLRHNGRFASAGIRVYQDTTQASGLPELQLASHNSPAKVLPYAPLAAAKMFDRIAVGWSPWLFLNDVPKTGVDVVLHLPEPSIGQQRYTVAVVGSVSKVAGGRVVSARPVCLARGACAHKDSWAQYINLEADEGVSHVKVTLQAMPQQFVQHLYKHEQQIIPLHQPDQWQAPARRSNTATVQNVLVQDRNQRALWKNYQFLQGNTGLAALLGVSARHQGSLADMLRRADFVSESVTATLTIDAGLQSLVQQNLIDHIGDTPRRGSLVLMDADSGDILALANYPAVDSAAQESDLISFHAENYSQSPLRINALHHDGRNSSAPGSVFKLVSATAFELEAKHDATLAEWLAGKPIAQLDKDAHAQGYPFSGVSDCYPTHPSCESVMSRWPVGDLPKGTVYNYRKHGIFETPQNRLQVGETHFGLTEALRSSLNTWFAFMADMTDKTRLGPLNRRLYQGVNSARSFAPQALFHQRPVLKAIDMYALDQPVRLDAGILGKNYPWHQADVLLGSASRFDSVNDKLNIRQQTLGLRMQTTPLQMVKVAATIATGQLVQPRLLLEINGHKAKNQQVPKLQVGLERIRQGMKGVAVSGTAKQTFAETQYHHLVGRVFGKTGTAQLRSNQQSHTSNNTVWFVGWLAPKNKHQSRIAFACMLQSSQTTGGSDCAKLVATTLLDAAL